MDVKKCFDDLYEIDANKPKLESCCSLYTLGYINLDELKCLFSKEFEGLKCPYICPESANDLEITKEPDAILKNRDRMFADRSRCSREEIDFINHIQKKFHNMNK